jgi:hypothetical protein
VSEIPLYRAWKPEQIIARELFPEGWYRAVDPFECGEEEGGAGCWTHYAVLGSASGWPVATVSFHGRSGTWCCGCPAGVRGALPCRHVAGVLWWVELARERATFLALAEEGLRAAWAQEVRAIRAIQSSPAPAPHNWRIRPTALFAALHRRGLVAGAGDRDPVWALVDQLDAVAA